MQSITDLHVKGHDGMEVSSLRYEIYYNEIDTRGLRFSPPDKCIKITQTYKEADPNVIVLEPANVHTIYNFVQRHYTKEELE